LRVSRGDERRFGGFDDFSECMNTNVLVLDGTSKLFLVMGIVAKALCSGLPDADQHTSPLEQGFV
jgi:hypothetical protein